MRRTLANPRATLGGLAAKEDRDQQYSSPGLTMIVCVTGLNVDVVHRSVSKPGPSDSKVFPQFLFSFSRRHDRHTGAESGRDRFGDSAF